MAHTVFPQVQKAVEFLDAAMMRHGYRVSKIHPSGIFGTTVRLYKTEEGGVSIALNHENLKGDDWPWYVEAQMKLALSRS